MLASAECGLGDALALVELANGLDGSGAPDRRAWSGRPTDKQAVAHGQVGPSASPAAARIHGDRHLTYNSIILSASCYMSLFGAAHVNGLRQNC